jgi:hypothetical protein
MRNLLRLSAIVFLLLAWHPTATGAVGYVNRTMYAGDNLFENPLVASPDNNLSTLFSLGAPVPDGTTVSLWNPTTRSFDITSEYTGGSWSIDFALLPGSGARLNTPLTFTATFVGEVGSRDPGTFSGPDGIYLFGDRVPQAATSTDIFLHILGRLPNAGEQFTALDGATQHSTTSTYLGGGAWDIMPSIGVGEAGFFNVGPVPEPSTAALVMLGLGMAWARLRRTRE